MRVDFASPDFSFARSRRQPWAYVHRIAQGLTERDFEVRVWTDREPTPGGAQEVPYPLETVPQLAGLTTWFGDSGSPFFRRLGRTDLLVSFLGWPNVASWASGPAAVTRVAALTSPLFVNGEWRNLLREGDSLVGRLHLLLSQLSARTLRTHRLSAFDGVVAPSSPVYRLLSSHLNGTPLLLAPSGIDADVVDFAHERAWNGHGREPLITFCGPPRRSRGLRVFFEALKILQRRRPDLKAQFLLRPDSREDRSNVRWLMRHVPTLPSPHRVRVEGNPLPRGDFLRSLSDSTLCVFPFQYPVSLTPLSLLEAVAMGVAVVITPVGDLPDAVGDGAGTITAGFRPPEVAEAALQVLEGVEAGGAGPARRTPPTWDEVASGWADFLRSLVPG